MRFSLGAFFLSANAGAVAIYTGAASWVGVAVAQAQIYESSLLDVGIPVMSYKAVADEAALGEWVNLRTGNGKLDVVVIFGLFPTSLYPGANVMPDGSVGELFIESTDGDAIINHADWTFYVGRVDRAGDNGPGGLQNMMDIGGISLDGGDSPMIVTAEGWTIAPHLVNFLFDRPLRHAELMGNWFVEAALAQNAAGTRSDPTIVRDGNLGRLIPTLLVPNRADPKGAVAAEIITWLMPKAVLPGEDRRVGFGPSVRRSCGVVE